MPPARKRELKGRLPQPRPVKQFLGIAGEREDVAPLDVLYVEFPVQGGEVAQPVGDAVQVGTTRSVQVTTVFLMSPAMMVGTFMSVPAPAYRIVRSSPLAPT